MGKVKIGKSQKMQKNVHTGSPVESAFSKDQMLAIAENVMQKHKHTFERLAQAEASEEMPQISKIELHDKRARQYAKAARKESKKMNDFLLAKEINLSKRADEIEERIKETSKKIESISSFCKVQNQDIARLDKDKDKLAHHLELIDQELKIKPVHIKETKTLERFDHRLLIINLVLIFLNIILLIK